MNSRSYRLRVIIVVAGLLFVSFSFYAYQIFYATNIQVDKDDTYLYIPTGANFDIVLDSLQKKQALGDVISFAFVSRIVGYRDNVKPGRYILKKNSSNLSLIRRLKRGAQDAVNLTFNNIRTKQDLAFKISEKMEFDSSQLSALLNSDSLIAVYGFNRNTIMSMFIPNTYQVYWTTPASEFMQRMKNEYDRFWTAERKAKAASIGLTQAQVSTVASIVEAETNQDKEKPTIAGVYMNRYHTDMLLQADPTVKFATGDFSIKRVTQVHTAIESPYNTYKYKGLPPGPINLPSIASIDAVLNYEKHKYLYFCASSTAPGFHDFAENFKDHVKNAKKYRDHLDKLNIH